jgi:hypothetical protein
VCMEHKCKKHQCNFFIKCVDFYEYQEMRLESSVSKIRNFKSNPGVLSLNAAVFVHYVTK